MRRRRFEVVTEEEEVLEEEVEEVTEDREEPAEDSVEEAQDNFENVAAEVAGSRPATSDAVPADEVYRELIEFAKSFEERVSAAAAVEPLVAEILSLYSRYCELRKRKRELVKRNQLVIAAEGVKSRYIIGELTREISRVEREMRRVRRELVAKLYVYRDGCGMRCGSCPIKHVCREFMR